MNPFNNVSEEKSTVAPGNPPENINGTSDANPPSEYVTPEGIQLGTPDIYIKEGPGFVPAQPVPVGGVILRPEPIEYNTGRKTVSLKVRNTGDRPIQIGSHFHFFEVNRYMEFDRRLAFGMHLNIPATTAIRFEPGEEKEIELVAYSGKRVAIGFNDLVNGYTGGEDSPTYYPVEIRALNRMKEYGFKSIPEDEAEAEYTQPQTKK